jgi:hypothetical protein
LKNGTSYIIASLAFLSHSIQASEKEGIWEVFGLGVHGESLSNFVEGSPPSDTSTILRVVRECQRPTVDAPFVWQKAHPLTRENQQNSG